MSDYIPIEVQEEILKRLPVKSLIQCRSVSKAWKSLIDSSDFIASHSTRHAHSHRLFVRYEDSPEDDAKRYVSFADDDNFPQERFEPTVPLLIERLSDTTTIMVGSSHGLLCWYGSQADSNIRIGNGVAVIWNPSIRKSVEIDVRNVLGGEVYLAALGFGVCPGSADIMLVKITCSALSFNTLMKMRSTCIPWEVEIFTLSSGCWRSSRGNTPPKSIIFTWSQATIDRFIYWLALDGIPGEEFKKSNTIMSFDMTNEEMREVILPHSIAFKAFSKLSIFKLMDSLAVIEYSLDSQKPVCSVWEMKHGVSTSFTKLYTIKKPDTCVKRVLGFRKSGKPVMFTQDPNTRNVFPLSLVIYEPCSESSNDFGVYGLGYSFFFNSYTETLLLLNVPES